MHSGHSQHIYRRPTIFSTQNNNNKRTFKRARFCVRTKNQFGDGIAKIWAGKILLGVIHSYCSHPYIFHWTTILRMHYACAIWCAHRPTMTSSTDPWPTIFTIFERIVFQRFFFLLIFEMINISSGVQEPRHWIGTAEFRREFAATQIAINLLQSQIEKVDKG